MSGVLRLTLLLLLHELLRTRAKRLVAGRVQAANVLEHDKNLVVERLVVFCGRSSLLKLGSELLVLALSLSIRVLEARNVFDGFSVR